jgi:hypothetical protein
VDGLIAHRRDDPLERQVWSGSNPAVGVLRRGWNGLEIDKTAVAVGLSARVPVGLPAGRTVVEFRVLGPFEVVDDERSVPLGGPKQRALLAVLLLHF